MNWTLKEIQGLERQLELTIDRANRIREHLAVATDPSQQTKLEYDLEQAEGEIRKLKAQLATQHDLGTSEGRSLLAGKVERLDIEQMGIIHLVNCNRRSMQESFWRAFDERTQDRFQFYFVGACPTQMPHSFCERMLYELIIDELEEDERAIHFRRRANSQRVLIHPLPLGRNLERSKKRFRLFFSKHFESRDDLAFDDFLRTGLPRLHYEYVVLVFEIHESNWQSFLPGYFEWLIQTFSNTHDDVPTFLFFFVLYADGLHEDENRGKPLLDPLRQLTDKYRSSVLLTPFFPALDKDLKGWFIDRGERNAAKIEEVIDSLVKGLKTRDRRQYEEHRRLNMDDIERLQEVVYEVVNGRKKDG